MTDRPIIFSGPMVRALLEGRKTQTRRLASSPLRRCQVGDRLYVREAWRTLQKVDCLKPTSLADDRSRITYDADPENRNPLWAFGKGRPSIHMPRWASRLTLIVEEVRFQRLHEISEEEALAEGVEVTGREVGCPEVGSRLEAYPREDFADLWNSLHTKPGERWADNPAIVALTFRVVHANIDSLTSEPSP
ncbi:hypothetical protein [Rhizorhabdus sp.]|uniref:hypothetical protein n=1 Tax=Rhizorhabdus sp. TaxID=1968843 RepID=UPI0035AEB6E8